MAATFPLHQRLPQLQHALFEWWQAHGRVLPWRAKQTAPNEVEVEQPTGQTNTPQVREKAFQSYLATHLGRDPYHVVVAELMLQQTQVDRVLPKYQAWMKNWPTLADLAKAQLSEVIIFWQGLGYNRRARFLWLLAKVITDEHAGVWPTSEEELLKLPGLGKYTARAVLSFAFGHQVAVVDTNVKRVLRRVLEGKEASASQVPTEKEWFQLADSVIPTGQADPWNQLIMDLGALVCTAKAPKCERCPIQDYCQAQQLALALGFTTYREYLASLPTVPRAKKGIRFEETDRYFRGRILDLLRESPLPEEKLEQRLEEEFGLVDMARRQKLLSSLEKEGMIKRNGELLSLG